MEKKDILIKSKWHSLIVAFIFFIFFSVLFAFETKVGELWPISDISSYKIKNFFDSYHIYAWIIISFLSVLLFFILNIFTRFIKNYKLYFQLFLLSLSLLPWYLFAKQLVYHENRYADYAKAIISYIWYPLLITIKDFIILLLMLIVFVHIFIFLKLLLKWKILKKK